MECGGKATALGGRVGYAADIESPASFRPQFPDLPAIKIAGAGHWLMLDKPDEFNAALDTLLAQVH